MTRSNTLLAIAAAAFLAMPALSRADPRADVQRALERIVAGGGFRADVTGAVFGPGTPATSGTIDVVFPDRIHARTEMIDFITTPGGAWINLFGVWTPVDREQIPVTAFSPRAMRKAIASIGDVRADGAVMTNRCDERIYRFRASGQLPGASADGDARIWICASDGRPVRLEATDASSGGRINLVFDWSHAARVEAPPSEGLRERAHSRSGFVRRARGASARARRRKRAQAARCRLGRMEPAPRARTHSSRTVATPFGGSAAKSRKVRERMDRGSIAQQARPAPDETFARQFFRRGGNAATSPLHRLRRAEVGTTLAADLES